MALWKIGFFPTAGISPQGSFLPGSVFFFAEQRTEKLPNKMKAIKMKQTKKKPRENAMPSLRCEFLSV